MATLASTFFVLSPATMNDTFFFSSSPPYSVLTFTNATMSQNFHRYSTHAATPRTFFPRGPYHPSHTPSKLQRRRRGNPFLPSFLRMAHALTRVSIRPFGRYYAPRLWVDAECKTGSTSVPSSVMQGLSEGVDAPFVGRRTFLCLNYGRSPR